MGRFQAYLREVLFRPLGGIWLVVTGLASLLAWLGVGDSWSTPKKVVAASALASASLLIYVVAASYDWYKRSFSWLTVRSIHAGTHYYAGKRVMIIDRGDWIQQGQVMTLYLKQSGSTLPICLINIDSFTTEHYPQAIVLKPLTTDNLDELLDGSRLPSLVVKPELTEGYIQWQRPPEE